MVLNRLYPNIYYDFPLQAGIMEYSGIEHPIAIFDIANAQGPTICKEDLLVK